MHKIFQTSCFKTNDGHLSWICLILLGAIVFSLSWFTEYCLLSLPHPLSINDSSQHNDSFIAERAWNDLKILTSFGTRPTGSHANEVLTVSFFNSELSSIKRGAHQNQQIHLDIQVTSGAYELKIYRNVQNVIVRLDGSDVAENSVEKNHALMLNCHFDSVAGSSGASDDAASCCVMMEILRVLSQQEKRLRHSVIFLFNGAEEPGLLASHGFITQHTWAKDIRAFINLESVGSNGKEILFQSGPNHGWLIDMYKNVPYPNGQVLAEEIFQSGLIPSDTDFRIFRDYGHIPGMDFAHFINGYRYHTKYDRIDYLSPGVLQHTGDNILTLVKKTANSDQLADTDAYANVRMEYYDILNFIFISYSEPTGYILNIFIAILSVTQSYYFLHAKNVSCCHVFWEFCFGLFATICSLLMGGIVCYLIAIELDFSGNTMSWYSHTYYSIALYGFPMLAVESVFYAIPWHVRNSLLSLALQTQAHLNGVNFVWTVGIIILTILRYRSAYVLMMPVLLTWIVNVIIGLIKPQNTIGWLCIHVVGQMPFIFWGTYLYHEIVAVFIPIAGRSGANENPDINIGLITCFFTMFIGSYLIPLVGLLRNPKYFPIIAFSIFLLARLSLIGSYFGFPYSDDPANPTPQRHFITHAVRKVYDLNGSLRYNDSGYLFQNLDRNTKKTIDNLVAPETLVDQKLIPMCNELPYRGIPTNSKHRIHSGGFWLPAPAPIVDNEVQVNGTTLKISDNKWQLQLAFNGSYMYSLQIRTRPGVNLLKWNLFNEINGDVRCFVRITHGLEAPPLQSIMEFNTKIGHTGPLVDISIVTFHWETSFNPTPDFANLLARLPKWAHPMPSIASLQARVF